MNGSRALLRIALAVSVVVLGACAQCGPPRGDAGAPGGPGGPPDRSGGQSERMGARGMSSATPGSPAAARSWMHDQTAMQLASARERIAITVEQSPAWDRFAESVGALVADLLRTAPEAPSMQAPQRIGLRLDLARNRYAALEDVSDAMNALYAVLSTEQRTRADRMLLAVVPPLYDGAALVPATTADPMPGRDGGGARGPGRGRQPGAP